MARTLQIHVGLPKCGSSSLQRFLFENATDLLEKGFHYPALVDRKIGNATPFVQSFATGHSRAVFEHHNPGYDPENARKAFFAALEDKSAPNTIMSSEGLNALLQRDLDDRFLTPFDRTVVHLVIRDRVSWLLSHYTQAIKTGKYTFDFESFLHSPVFAERVSKTIRFSDSLDFWHHKVGRENTRLYLIGPGRPGTVGQFLQGIGLDGATFQAQSERSNRSPSPFLVFVLASVRWDTLSSFLQARSYISRIVRQNDDFLNRTLVSQQSHEKIDTFFEADTKRLLGRQTVVSKEDIQPAFDASKSYVSFEEMRESDAFFRVKAQLAEKDIELR